MDTSKSSALGWFSTRVHHGHDEIYDPVRKKFVRLTPEEEVRQKMMHYLVHQAMVPMGLMAAEYQIHFNSRSKRCDIVVYSRQRNPVLIVECKAPQVKLDQKTVEQIAIYNSSLRVNFLTITNGIETFCIQFDKAGLTYKLVSSIPVYAEMCAVLEKLDK
jgi:hypothetical protein